MLRYRLPDGSSENSPWLGWLESLMILRAFFTHRLVYMSWREGSSPPMMCLAVRTTLCRALRLWAVLLPYQARIVAYQTSGCDPSIMGIGPVTAITEALKKAGLSLKDMDLVDVNEVFTAQYLAVAKALGLDPEKSNVNGGAIALGHPLGASGSRITEHLVHELRRRSGKYAVGSACIGGGQGIAIILENTQ
ncbi:3-ketoacyl-CoA thiolase, mitochondrial-like [Myxocyprinus asiaticus]|uniref:3-ketoacyl-CoA thiolase, mitochondrial-like n=1 Tax=Myxocyprinus asiaticus TaxID=70543 RepID=UPI002221ED8A|nr:3-ketoacyl-CoA thiolase, mitochondrial-like [Myxocyprinus asiaticus]XP_051524281.1 3-ketoacyl-CoA thiolase, mitochondrial-like [Myxocyprinus asiaticus]XP_051524282.1 3-ketoacyl-CoA thiolase, mitochondrial-like [Myxocyprinus asiaticus]